MLGLGHRRRQHDHQRFRECGTVRPSLRLLGAQAGDRAAAMSTSMRRLRKYAGDRHHRPDVYAASKSTAMLSTHRNWARRIGVAGSVALGGTSNVDIVTHGTTTANGLFGVAAIAIGGNAGPRSARRCRSAAGWRRGGRHRRQCQLVRGRRRNRRSPQPRPRRPFDRRRHQRSKRAARRLTVDAGAGVVGIALGAGSDTTIDTGTVTRDLVAGPGASVSWAWPPTATSRSKPTAPPLRKARSASRPARSTMPSITLSGDGVG